MSAASELDLYLANEEGQNLFDLASKKLEAHPLLTEKTVAESFAYDPDEEIRNFIDTLRHSQQLRKAEFERVKRLIVDETDIFLVNVDDVNTTPVDVFGDDFADEGPGEDGDEVLLGDEESTTGKSSARMRAQEPLGASIDSYKDIERSATRIATGREEGGAEDALATVTRMRRLIHSAMVSEEDFELGRKSAPSKQDLLKRIDQSIELFKPMVTADRSWDGGSDVYDDEDSLPPYHSEDDRIRGRVRRAGRSSHAHGHARGRGRGRGRGRDNTYDDQASSPSPDGPRSAAAMQNAHDPPLKGSSEEFFLNQAVAERMREIDRNVAYRGYSGEGTTDHRRGHHHHHGQRSRHGQHGEQRGDENKEPAVTGTDSNGGGGLVNVDYLLGQSARRARSSTKTEYDGRESGESESDADAGMYSPSPTKARHVLDPQAGADSPETPFSHLAAAARGEAGAMSVEAAARAADAGSRVHFQDVSSSNQQHGLQVHGYQYSASHGGRVLFAPEAGGVPMSGLADRTVGEADNSSVHHVSTENSYGFTPTQDPPMSNPLSALRRSDPELKWI